MSYEELKEKTNREIVDVSYALITLFKIMSHTSQISQNLLFLCERGRGRTYKALCVEEE